MKKSYCNGSRSIENIMLKKEPGVSVTPKKTFVCSMPIIEAVEKGVKYINMTSMMTSITGLQTLFSCIFSSTFTVDIKEINICWKDMPGAFSIIIFVRKDGLVKTEKIPPRKRYFLFKELFQLYHLLTFYVKNMNPLLFGRIEKNFCSFSHFKSGEGGSLLYKYL